MARPLPQDNQLLELRCCNLWILLYICLFLGGCFFGRYYFPFGLDPVSMFSLYFHQIKAQEYSCSYPLLMALQLFLSYFAGKWKYDIIILPFHTGMINQILLLFFPQWAKMWKSAQHIQKLVDYIHIVVLTVECFFLGCLTELKS